MTKEICCEQKPAPIICPQAVILKAPGKLISMSEIRYAKNKDGQSVAYQVTGEGPLDLVFIPDWVTNLEVMREEPTVAKFLDRLGRAG